MQLPGTYFINRNQLNHYDWDINNDIYVKQWTETIIHALTSTTV